MSSRRELKDKRKNDGQKRRRDLRVEVANQYVLQMRMMEDQYLTKLCKMSRWKKLKFFWVMWTTKITDPRQLVKQPKFVPDGMYLRLVEGGKAQEGGNEVPDHP